jgi:hypothetical protein
MWKRSFALVLCMACLASCESQPTDKQAAFNDVVMPNGTVIKNVPKGITKAQLLKKLERSGYNINELLTAEEERVVYQIRGLDGPTYTISVPPGKTRDEVWAKILARVPQAGIPTPPYGEDGLPPDAVADYTGPQRTRGTAFYGYGTSAQRVGNMTFYSDGTSAQRVGNMTFYSDGTSAQRVGNMTFYSDGITCQTIGSTQFCN